MLTLCEPVVWLASDSDKLHGKVRPSYHRHGFLQVDAGSTFRAFKIMHNVPSPQTKYFCQAPTSDSGVEGDIQAGSF